MKGKFDAWAKSSKNEYLEDWSTYGFTVITNTTSSKEKQFLTPPKYFPFFSLLYQETF
jgi:hypothetical protein